METTITKPYQPGDRELRTKLRAFGEQATVSYEERREIDLGLNRDAPLGYRQKYVVEHQDRRISGTETNTALGNLLSLEGDVGFASAVILLNALVFGVPTATYTDEAIKTGEGTGERYHDLSAEWYTEQAREHKIPEKRLLQHGLNFEFDPIEWGRLEEFAEMYFTAHV